MGENTPFIKQCRLKERNQLQGHDREEWLKWVNLTWFSLKDKSPGLVGGWMGGWVEKNILMTADHNKNKEAQSKKYEINLKDHSLMRSC